MSLNPHSKIRETVQGCLPGSKVILFGSRARSDADHLSDYDLLIITPATMTPAEKLLWGSKLDRAIIDLLHIPVDILLNSQVEIENKQDLPGHIIATIMREGILL